MTQTTADRREASAPHADKVLTMGAMLRETASAHAQADALVFPDLRLTHAGLYAEAARWARAFIAMGVRPGEHVGVLLTTCPEFVSIMFGAQMAGAVVVPVNARYQPANWPTWCGMPILWFW